MRIIRLLADGDTGLGTTQTFLFGSAVGDTLVAYVEASSWTTYRCSRVAVSSVVPAKEATITPMTVAGFSAATLGLFQRASWWEAVAVASAAVGMVALVPYWLAASHAGETTPGFNVLIPFIDLPKSIDVRYFEADVNGVKKITSGSTARIDLRGSGGLVGIERRGRVS